MPRSVTAFSTGTRVIGIGQDVASDDPILQGRRHLFVEQATANPGEQSGARRTEPPRAGKGSSAKAWRKFARAVSGTDGWDARGRDEIIARLEADGLIDPA